MHYLGLTLSEVPTVPELVGSFTIVADFLDQYNHHDCLLLIRQTLTKALQTNHFDNGEEYELNAKNIRVVLRVGALIVGLQNIYRKGDHHQAGQWQLCEALRRYPPINNWLNTCIGSWRNMKMSLPHVFDMIWHAANERQHTSEADAALWRAMVAAIQHLLLLISFLFETKLWNK